MKSITIKALILGGLALAQAAWADVYRGTIGKEKVVMELIMGDMMGDGRFFTEREHKSHRLIIWPDDLRNEDTEPMDDFLVVVPDVPTRPDGGASSLSEDELLQVAHMVLLIKPAEQRLQGVWREPNGTRLPVDLVRISEGDVASDNAVPVMQGLKTVSLYDYLLLPHDMPEFLGEKDIGPYRVAWWQHRATGVKTFQLVSGYPAQTMAALNQTLQQRWWQTVLGPKICENSDGTLDQRIQITLLSASLVSYVEQLHNSQCQATITDEAGAVESSKEKDKLQAQAIRPYTLSTRTGKPVSLSQLFSIGETNAAGEYQLLYADFDRALPRWLTMQLQALYHDKLAASPDPTAPLLAKEWQEVSRNWFATEQGLRVYARLPYDVFGETDQITAPQWTVLPWSFVNSHPALNVPDAERNLP
ncbi:hypothetical protein [Dickeya aquatica]|uniref:Uncharacterized protein n=1 Tax=Dickeya aquatica TaxID=1401087 RepID=A0A375A9T4_9GAMM|nr:hypothetical protein [Dickeya aquatica]SLM62389.1 FIG00613623: hypothetical protein [Dickeya aquatica]